MSKDLFYFNRQDRIAAVVLLAVIVSTVLIRRNLPVRAHDIAAVPADSLEQVWTRTRRDTVYVIRKPKEWSRKAKPESNTESTAYSYRMADTVRDTLYTVRYRVKHRPSAKIDLNTADSMQLTGLPGIGAWTAQKIMRYRSDLGGFVSQEQLLEIDGLPDSLLQWFTVTDTVPPVRIRVNLASLTELRHHPYMSFYQARAIVELRRDRGKVQGPGQLSMLEEFTERDLERLEPYLDYE